MGLKPKAGTGRNIFEDVGEAPRPVAVPGGIDSVARSGRSAVRRWLLGLGILVVIMITLGGLTRLTDSGLSITEWAPISGTIPPLSAEDWQAEFDAYREIPQYQLLNRGMSLDEFKEIYWWEWAHRQLGRFIGLFWAVGFVWFAARRQFAPGWTVPMFGLGALIGVQGAIGWAMVHSGLQDGMIAVASYWLAAHLGTAFVILGVIFWGVMRLGRRQADMLVARRAGDAGLARAGTVLIGAGLMQIVLGALVAGIDAGRAFPTWPLMGDGFFPPDPFTRSPLWRNFFEDAGLVQFIHRMWGYGLAALAIALWLRARRSALVSVRGAYGAMLALMALQIVIGIVTVLYSAPWQIAIVHQFTAILLWVALLRTRFAALYPAAQSLRG